MDGLSPDYAYTMVAGSTSYTPRFNLTGKSYTTTETIKTTEKFYQEYKRVGNIVFAGYGNLFSYGIIHVYVNQVDFYMCEDDKTCYISGTTYPQNDKITVSTELQK